MTKINSIYRLILKHKKTFLLFFPITGFLFWLGLPVGIIFPDEYSTLILDSNDSLLRATLAGDQQYRFPPDTTDLPEKYVTTLLTYEDKRFFSHLGIDPLALANAAYVNFKSGKRIRGGSTITMQVARLANPKERTYLNKFFECFTALKLSLHFSKEEILKLYSDHVPMGGNIVGIQAASYRYFGKHVTELTWSEAALFAVLPNSPSMINLERDRPLLIRKRNNLLKKMTEKGIIDRITFVMSSQEPLPHQNLPFIAPHFTRLVMNNRNGSRKIKTTLDKIIQKQVLDMAKIHHLSLSDQGISNLAVMVVETKTAKVRAYLGSQNFHDQSNGGQVDGVQAFRSTGSLLKPFLAAKSLDRGPYTMASKIQDVPTFYGTFAPQNASKEFSGLVSLEQLLIRSLNVPSVRLLNTYGVSDFYDFLTEARFKGLFRSPEGYGLSLILGGAEASLFELVQLYLSLANLGGFQELSTREADIVEPNNQSSKTRLFSEGAAWLVLNALSQLSRPGIEFYWNQFNNQIPVAWKTGTSYGQKDGWAIGVNKQWTIGVWVGNFTGEGNASLSGARSAAPLLFDLFNALTKLDQPMWFDEPEYDLKEVVCCKESGYPAGPYCPETMIMKSPLISYKPGTCPFHRRYLVDRNTGKSVCSLCWNGIETTWANRYIVPPSVREILIKSGRKVDSIPVHSDYCPNFHDDNPIELVYPVNGIKIFIPRDYDGKHEKIVFSAKHQLPSTHLFWYLNDSLVGKTVENHQFPIELNPGTYRLTVQDEGGFLQTISFTAFRKGA